MPNSAEHREKYLANRLFLDTANNGAPLSTLDASWAATVAFYAALHLVDRLAARSNLHPSSHADRLRFVAQHHRAIFAPYNDLKVASEVARYGTRNQFTRAYPDTVVQHVLIDQHLVAIENYVENVFTPPPPPGASSSAGS